MRGWVRLLPGATVVLLGAAVLAGTSPARRIADFATDVRAWRRAAFPRVLALRGGVQDAAEYSSKDAEKYDRVLWDMLAQHPDEIYFLNTVFNFLQRRTPCFNGPNAERNYQILIDTLTKQKGAYLEHIARGGRAKAPEPMPQKAPAQPYSESTQPRPAQSVDAALQEVSAAQGGAIDGFVADGSDAAKCRETCIPGYGTLRDFTGQASPAVGVDESQGNVEVDKRFAAADAGDAHCAGGAPGGVIAPVGAVGVGTETLQKPVNNGGRTDAYIWTQTLTEVVIEVFLPKNTLTKTISVETTGGEHSRLVVTLQPPGGSVVTLLEGEFEEEIKPDQTMWVKEDDMLVITVEKMAREMGWWACVLKGHAKVDLQKIEPQQSQLDDLDDDTRQTVEKMMYDQKMKAQGKPTLDDAKKQAQMKQFMDMHPEMDFSKCKFG